MTAIPSEANAQDEAPQNVAIYASKRVPISFAEIEKLAPDAKVKLLAGKKSPGNRSKSNGLKQKSSLRGPRSNPTKRWSAI